MKYRNRIIMLVLLFSISMSIFSGCNSQNTSTSMETSSVPTETVKPTIIPTKTPTPTPTKEPLKIEDIISNCYVEEDDMTGEKTYYSKKSHTKDSSISPKYHDVKDGKAYFDFYLKERKGSLIPVISILYYGDEWVFIDEWLAQAGDNIAEEFDLSSHDEATDISNGKVFEVYAFSADSKMISALKQIVKESSGKMRFQGSKGKVEFKLSSSEINGIEHTLAMYDEYKKNQ